MGMFPTCAISQDLELAEKSCEDGAAVASQLLSRRARSQILNQAVNLNTIVIQIAKICAKSFDKSVSVIPCCPGVRRWR
jgi:hypothetical protein